jgi:RNA recognition motif-containing protein
MPSKLYVGNLASDVDKEQLQALFAAHGEVVSSRLTVDHETGMPAGFGFVNMAKDADALKAISSLDGQDFRGRNIEVRRAKPRKPRAD